MERQDHGIDEASADQHGPKVIDTTRARQGFTTGHVRYVLTISVLLVVVAFAIIFMTGA